MRKVFILIFLSFTAVMFLIINNQYTQVLPNDVFKYYVNNFYSDTGAQNAVTSIYLSYRVYDTLFETLMLLISVSGVIYFSRHEEEH